MSAAAKTERCFCLADDPSKAANDVNTVTTKAVIEAVSEEDRTVLEESADSDSKVGSKLSRADNTSADDDDDDDDRVLFNADIVCFAHGEICIEFFVVFLSKY